MPSTKRPLAESDQNASNASSEPNKCARILKKVGNRYALYALGDKENLAVSNIRHDSNPVRKEEITYATKDNSKLRTFLRERRLSTSGTRDELISRLENTSIDYDSLPSGQITEMLKARRISWASQGPKEVKLQRLRYDDTLDRDTGNSEEQVLSGKLYAWETILNDLLMKQESAANSENSYSSLSPARLSALLERRELSLSGSKTAQIARLQNDDRKSLTKSINEMRTMRDSLKLEMEARVGHPVNATEDLDRERKRQQLNSQMQQQASSPPKPVPICGYKWQDSHWADRTEAQLREICSRREMPGSGPKAAMLKWLDTGEVDYEDLYAGGLEMICRERGVHYKCNAKKVDLVRLLKEDDEKH